jgi:hypothetical protein
LLPLLHQAAIKRKKNVVLGTKRKQDKVVANQVIIDLPPFHGPRSHLDIVIVEHILGHLFEAFRTYLRQKGLILLLGMTPSHPKELEHHR